MATFTKTVIVPRRNTDGTPQRDEQQQPIPLKTLGTFTFHEPSLRERHRINVQVDRDLAEIGGIDHTRMLTLRQIRALAHFPMVIDEPKNFDIDTLDDEDMRALLEAFDEGLLEISPKNS